MKNEIWKDIKGYEKLYQVSNIGRVKSLPKISRRNYLQKEIILNANKANGYVRVTLYKNNQSKAYSIHRLVAEAFIPNPENKRTVNHKNGIKIDNGEENLEWNTYKENVQHSYDNGFQIPLCGEFNGAAKLTEKQVEEIRVKYIPFKYSMSKLANEYSVGVTTIFHIIRYETYENKYIS